MLQELWENTCNRSGKNCTDLQAKLNKICSTPAESLTAAKKLIYFLYQASNITIFRKIIVTALYSTVSEV